MAGGAVSYQGAQATRDLPLQIPLVGGPTSVRLSTVRLVPYLPAAVVSGTWDGRAKPSLFSTVKYSFRLTLPNIGSR